MLSYSKEEWLQAFPDLTIDAATAPKPLTFSEARLSEIASSVWSKGYLTQSPVFSAAETAPLYQALKRLSSKGIPPVYIYLFDQPWFLFSKLNALIAHFLGEEFALLPNLWAWYFDRPGDRGWRPHQDCHLETVFDLGGDQMLMSLSLWIPLTDATPENGCMYVLPRDQEQILKGNPDMLQEKLEPHAIPLPAKAGSVLGWPQDIVHWGGYYSDRAKTPRASLSLEFQNTAFEPLVAPFLDAGSPPPFEERRRFIALQYEKYKHIAAKNEIRFFSE